MYMFIGLWSVTRLHLKQNKKKVMINFFLFRLFFLLQTIYCLTNFTWMAFKRWTFTFQIHWPKMILNFHSFIVFHPMGETRWTIWWNCSMLHCGWNQYNIKLISFYFVIIIVQSLFRDEKKKIYSEQYFDCQILMKPVIFYNIITNGIKLLCSTVIIGLKKFSIEFQCFFFRSFTIFHRNYMLWIAIFEFEWKEHGFFFLLNYTNESMAFWTFSIGHMQRTKFLSMVQGEYTNI